MKTTVMTIANRLHYTQGLSQSQALKAAWQMVKQGKFYTKVRGVTFGNRQKALALKSFTGGLYRGKNSRQV
ncbi:hypothetical protein Dtox_3656 [Desulfofarcimen acetoxidans DSM 771]|uniref:Uncharacterized protein n=1 Tax=Desulfofarcimen acetoxidans (strain ATCC 49208 / DSM 771 / KCTC 5769 / VKM B-1644 / 5575) TaxID=485916 RepID=C8VWK2_DESAS|nr:hypothetical protein [Desulfofarcimen acetoxidans]ACV64366.1 hypothetical protein Dtox_3656 [Desulfofarcimen acetoxidans DSM 771]